MPRRYRPAAATGLLKISELAERSGVPTATIKHYVHEGLLPRPKRTSRNMAYYDPAVVPRIIQIKDLQRTRFLPLKLIRRVLDELEPDSPSEIVSATIGRVLAEATPREERTREEILAAGMPAEELELFRDTGLVRPLPKRRGQPERYAGEDLEILLVLASARRAGLSPSMLPPGILGEYMQALAALVRVELRMFTDGVLPQAGDRLGVLTEAATLLSERLVVLLRRRLLLPTLKTVVVEQERPPPRRRTRN